MMVERLTVYKKQSKRLPDRVYVYRDGVSEVYHPTSSEGPNYLIFASQGQFNSVIQEELPQILDSFKKFDTKERSTPYRPKLTIIICGKRHHARFFPTDAANADRNGNTRPGTVVDKGVTDVFSFDFYLQAHAGLQGTVRPTHYTVVYDENRLGADEIQQGTHHASYLYARATKSVSLVPAAYYSDLACERGRCYLNDFLNAPDDKTSSIGTGKGKGKGKGKADRDEEKARVFAAAKDMWGEGLHEDVKDSMFYI
jgi:eukaryotic translation initiation factor 2C